MMHPIDVTTKRDSEVSAPGTRTGWWAIFALVIVMALLVTAVVSLSGSEADRNPQAPQPTEAPLDPGV